MTQAAAFRPGTRLAHRRALKLFIAFSLWYRQPYFKPSNPHVLAFIQYLTSFLKSPSSVRNIVSSLSTSYKRIGWDPAPFTTYYVAAALKSIEVNSRHMPDQKDGILPDQLDALISAILWQTKDYTLVCVLAFGFAGFFRQSNMVPRSAKEFDPTRHFTQADVTHTKEGLTVTVKWTKTLQKYKDATAVYLPPITGRSCCPVMAYRSMLITAPTAHPAQPLFSFQDRTPMTLRCVNRHLTQGLKTIGLDPKAYSLHSLRRGGASAVWGSGVANPTDIIRHGTWSSDSWRAYAHRPAASSTVALGLASLAK